jgi:DnaJ domain
MKQQSHTSSRSRIRQPTMYRVCLCLLIYLYCTSLVCLADEEVDRGYLRATKDRKKDDEGPSSPQLDRAELERQQEEDRFRRIQEEREAAFEAKLARMSEDQRKNELNKKKADARIVKRVIKAAASKNPYKILGLNNWEIHLPGQTLQFGKLKLRIPSITLFRLSAKTIRKKYRALATKIHPDKNRDGRATQAFIAVESAVSMLSDETERAEIDSVLFQARQERIDRLVRLSNKIAGRSSQVVHQASRISNRFVKPFGVPALVIGSLLV